MTDKGSMTIYAVVRIDNGVELYLGPNLYEAAERWVEGTCHGSGLTKIEAMRAARDMAAWFRDKDRTRKLWGKAI
jgi:hypothetical protein